MYQFDLEVYLEAVRKLDLDRILSFLAQDVEVVDPGFPQPIRGKDALLRMVRLMMPLLGGVEITPEKVVQQGSDLAVLMRVRAWYKRNLEFPSGKVIPLEGRCVDLPVAGFIALDGSGKVSRVTRIRDNLLLMGQLGLSEAQMRDVMEEVVSLTKAA